MRCKVLVFLSMSYYTFTSVESQFRGEVFITVKNKTTLNASGEALLLKILPQKYR